MAKQTPVIAQSTFDFFKKLKKNNNREWFNKNKDLYLQELSLMESFAAGLLDELNKHDEIETLSGKKSLFRIYRDTRFSNDKTPYKNHWSGRFKRATKYRRGGYYFHIEQGNSFLGGGFWGPEPQDLKRIRDEIAFDPKPINKILQSKSFRTMFGQLKGDQVKSAPRGYDASNEAIDLLRHKQFLLIRNFTDEEVLAPGFLKEASLTFKAMRPFFDYMSEILTMDSNGIIQ